MCICPLRSLFFPLLTILTGGDATNCRENYKYSKWRLMKNGATLARDVQMLKKKTLRIG